MIKNESMEDLRVSAYMTLMHESFKLAGNVRNIKSNVDRLISARNDFVAFQTVFYSDRHYSVGTVNKEWLSHTNRIDDPQYRIRVEVISPFETHLYHEGLLPDSDSYERADILLHQDVKEYAAHTFSAVWVEMTIPKNANAGKYKVKVRAFGSFPFCDEELIDEQELELTVYPYVLSDKKDRSFYLDLWMQPSNIARKHDVPLWSDKHFAVLKNYIDSLAALGQKSILLIVSDSPWLGWGCYKGLVDTDNLFEYSMVGITRRCDGSFSYDFSVLQRYIDMCDSAGINGDIDVYGLGVVNSNPLMLEDAPKVDWPYPLRLRYLDESDGCMKYIRKREDIADYVSSLHAFFIENGTIDRVKISADEPAEVERYRECLSLINKYAPSFKFKTAINHSEFIAEFQNGIDVFAPYIAPVITNYDLLMQYKKKFPDKRFLWYVCMGRGRPNTFLRYSLIESRLIGIFNFYLGFDGFLRWAYTCWPKEPRKSIYYPPFDIGDNNIVYPANDGDVLLSLRYKNLLRGIDDYELLVRIKEKYGEAEANKLVSSVIHIGALSDLYKNNVWSPIEKAFSMICTDYDNMKEVMLSMLS